MGCTNVDLAAPRLVDAIGCRSAVADLGSARYREEWGSVNSLVSSTVHSDTALKTHRRPSVRLLGLAPAVLLLCGLFTVSAGPLAAPAAAAVPMGTVTTWPLTGIPPGLTNVVAISAGAYHSLALKSDGTVVAWGLDTYGQIDVPAGLTGVTAIAAGGDHSLA